MSLHASLICGRCDHPAEVLVTPVYGDDFVCMSCADAQFRWAVAGILIAFGLGLSGVFALALWLSAPPVAP